MHLAMHPLCLVDCKKKHSFSVEFRRGVFTVGRCRSHGRRSPRRAARLAKSTWDCSWDSGRTACFTWRERVSPTRRYQTHLGKSNHSLKNGRLYLSRIHVSYPLFISQAHKSVTGHELVKGGLKPELSWTVTKDEGRTRSPELWPRNPCQTQRKNLLCLGPRHVTMRSRHLNPTHRPDFWRAQVTHQMLPLQCNMWRAHFGTPASQLEQAFHSKNDPLHFGWFMLHGSKIGPRSVGSGRSKGGRELGWLGKLRNKHIRKRKHHQPTPCSSCPSQPVSSSNGPAPSSSNVYRVCPQSAPKNPSHPSHMDLLMLHGCDCLHRFNKNPNQHIHDNQRAHENEDQHKPRKRVQQPTWDQAANQIISLFPKQCVHTEGFLR